MEEKPNYYAIIPADVRYDTELKDKAKLLYGEITALSNVTGQCFASNKYFSDLFGVTITTISLLIKQLIEKGYLESEIKYKDNSKEIEHRYLRIVKGGYLKNLKGGYLKNLKGGIKENLNDNNINTNIININNTSINNKEIYKEIIDYLNFKLNRNFKCSTNNINKIKARINEGYTVDDFKKVIDIKYLDWNNTEYAKFLRPETLFGNKFEGYLNQPIRKRTLNDISLKELEEMENDANRVYETNENTSIELW